MLAVAILGGDDMASAIVHIYILRLRMKSGAMDMQGHHAARYFMRIRHAQMT